VACSLINQTHQLALVQLQCNFEEKKSAPFFVELVAGRILQSLFSRCIQYIALVSEHLAAPIP
jgi:hypothetical protein